MVRSARELEWPDERPRDPSISEDRPGWWLAGAVILFVVASLSFVGGTRTRLHDERVVTRTVAVPREAREADRPCVTRSGEPLFAGMPYALAARRIEAVHDDGDGSNDTVAPARGGGVCYVTWVGDPLRVGTVRRYR